MILTGQRRGEVAGLSWEELDRQRRTWTLPADRTKNRREHVVPLCGQCVAIFDELAGGENWPSRDLVFGRDRSGERLGFSKAKRQLDAHIKRLIEEGPGQGDARSFTPWRFHDLRRSLATGLQREGARFEVIEAVLNHKSGERSGVAGVYQRYNWHDEMRAALEEWSQHLAQIVAASSADQTTG